MLNEDGVPIPVHSLGLRAGDILSQPQQLCVVTLWQILRIGILVLKHGRSGRPKNRTLFCDDNLRVLFWRDADNTGSAAAEYQHQDIDRTKATRRSSFNVFSKQDSSREVVLRDVLEVSNSSRAHPLTCALLTYLAPTPLKHSWSVILVASLFLYAPGAERSHH